VLQVQYAIEEYKDNLIVKIYFNNFN